jgi:hypothetical protein
MKKYFNRAYREKKRELKVEHKNSHKAIKTISPRTENEHVPLILQIDT